MDAPKKPEENVEKLTESDLSQVVGGNPVVGETNFFKSIRQGHSNRNGHFECSREAINQRGVEAGRRQYGRRKKRLEEARKKVTETNHPTPSNQAVLKTERKSLPPQPW